MAIKTRIDLSDTYGRSPVMDVVAEQIKDNERLLRKIKDNELKQTSASIMAELDKRTKATDGD